MTHLRDSAHKNKNAYVGVMSNLQGIRFTFWFICFFLVCVLFVLFLSQRSVQAENKVEDTGYVSYFPVVFNQYTPPVWKQIEFDGQKITDMHLDNFAPNHLYVSVYPIGLFETTDGGVNWTQHSVRARINDIYVHPDAVEIMYLATWSTYSVYRTQDMGVSWEPISGWADLSPTLYSIAVNPISPTMMLVGSGNWEITGGEIFKTINSGQTWYTVSPSLTNALSFAFDPVSSTTIYAGTRYGGVKKSVDHGESWISINGGLPDDADDIYSLKFHPAYSEKLYAATSFGLYFRDTRTEYWQLIWEGDANDIVFLGDSTIYLGTGSGVSVSGNSGQTWQLLGQCGNGGVVNRLALDPFNSDILWVATNDGLWQCELQSTQEKYSYLQNVRRVVKNMQKKIRITTMFALFSLFIIGFTQVDNSPLLKLPSVQPDPKRTLPHDVEYIPSNIQAQEAVIVTNMVQIGQVSNWDHTSDFMLGTVAVSVILPECTTNCTQGGWGDNNINHIMDEINDGLSWWEDRASSVGAYVDFQIVTNSPLIVSTTYEPIDWPGGDASLCGDAGLWIDDVMGNLGYDDYSGGDTYLLEVRQYDDDLRDQYNTDWAITVFMVDSSNNPSGMFADTDCNGQTDTFSVAAWATSGGPYTTMNTVNNGFGTIFIDGVFAHEIGHVFGAPDEVSSGSCQTNASCNAQWGYLGGQNQNCVHSCNINVPLSMMRYPEDYGLGEIVNVIHTYTEQQLGWLDSDSDGISDPIDTFPDLALNMPPTQTSTVTPQFEGTTEDIPFPAALPTFTDETINRIAGVDYRINGGTWLHASASDGTFDSALENFVFEPLLCHNGVYSIDIRAFNSVGNYSSIMNHTRVL